MISWIHHKRGMIKPKNPSDGGLRYILEKDVTMTLEADYVKKWSYYEKLDYERSQSHKLLIIINCLWSGALGLVLAWGYFT